MKAGSQSISLFHFADGHHREINHWHDFDH
jgi:hypothetical protein